MKAANRSGDLRVAEIWGFAESISRLLAGIQGHFPWFHSSCLQQYELCIYLPLGFHGDLWPMGTLPSGSSPFAFRTVFSMAPFQRDQTKCLNVTIYDT